MEEGKKKKSKSFFQFQCGETFKWNSWNPDIGDVTFATRKSNTGIASRGTLSPSTCTVSPSPVRTARGPSTQRTPSRPTSASTTEMCKGSDLKWWHFVNWLRTFVGLLSFQLLFKTLICNCTFFNSSEKNKIFSTCEKKTFHFWYTEDWY